MPKHRIPLSEVFDHKSFIDDVQEYRIRQGDRIADLCPIYGIHPNTFFAIRSGRQQLSLTVACLLADYADLSLDKYRGAPDG